MTGKKKHEDEERDEYEDDNEEKEKDQEEEEEDEKEEGESLDEVVQWMREIRKELDLVNCHLCPC